MNKKNPYYQIIFVIFFIFCSFPLTGIHAEYMIPYPSFMPGNKLYRISRIIDSLNDYWYFGNIAKIKYHLNLSDKYLVEAKTLMEYKQYLLAIDALKRSDSHFLQLPRYYQKAREEKIDINKLQQLAADSFRKHKEIESNLLLSLPESFTWTPEKEHETVLPLHRMITNSIKGKEQALAIIVGY